MTPTPPPIDVAAILQRMAEREARAAELVPTNKASLFTVLASAGITRVTVIFDGYGDSGQIEDVTAFKGEDEADLPTDPVTITALSHDGEQPVATDRPVCEAIEALAYDLLGQKHCGWENNDGAYGEFTFDVTAGSIELDYNERFTASEHYGHEW